MENEYIEWNNKKIELQKSEIKHFVKKRQFWLYYVWMNLWNEESKQNPFIRPCLIINNYLKWDLILVVPLTTKFNKNLEDIFYKIDWEKYSLDKTSYLLLNQFKVISKKRLIRKIKKDEKSVLIENNEFLDIVEKLKSFI